VRVRAGVVDGEHVPDDAVVVEVVLERVTGTAHAGAGRVAALDHEVRDHAVEDDAVVEAVAGELAEVLDGLGRVVVVELDVDRPVTGLQRGGAHGSSRLALTRSSRRSQAPLSFRCDRWPGTRAEGGESD